MPIGLTCRQGATLPTCGSHCIPLSSHTQGLRSSAPQSRSFPSSTRLKKGNHPRFSPDPLSSRIRQIARNRRRAFTELRSPRRSPSPPLLGAYICLEARHPLRAAVASPDLRFRAAFLPLPPHFGPAAAARSLHSTSAHLSHRQTLPTVACLRCDRRPPSLSEAAAFLRFRSRCFIAAGPGEPRTGSLSSSAPLRLVVAG